MAKNDKDHAIVVGIKDYPAFDSDNPLQGPENDARAFRDWLVSKKGGDVPKENVSLIVSGDYGPPFTGPKVARPIVTDIQVAFENLQDLAEENRAAGNGYQVGRRLYIYLSGHGFAPTFEETALLMANATPQRVGPVYHVLGPYTANWFFRVRFFEEVFLFMDCCRELFVSQGFNKSFKEMNSPGAITKVKRFYGLATKWSGIARERDVDGVRRGIFTDVLIKGLDGAAADTTTGDVTALSLKNFIYNAMDETPANGPDPSNNPDIGPDLDFYPNAGDGFLIKKTAVPRFPVSIRFAAQIEGEAAEVRDGSDFSKVLAIKKNVPPVWELKLPRGKYLIQVLSRGLQKIVTVSGTGGVDVQF